MTDLSSERLDELEDQWNCEGCIAYEDMLALIAQARRTEQAERERDALRDAITHADLDSVARVLRDVIIGDSCEEDCECVIHGLDRLRAVCDRSLAQPADAGGA